MFNSNLGNVERVGRILLGVALLIIYPVYAATSFGWMLLMGLVPMASGLLGTCPIYSRLGHSTSELD